MQTQQSYRESPDKFLIHACSSNNNNSNSNNINSFPMADFSQKKLLLTTLSVTAIFFTFTCHLCRKSDWRIIMRADPYTTQMPFSFTFCELLQDTAVNDKRLVVNGANTIYLKRSFFYQQQQQQQQQQHQQRQQLQLQQRQMSKNANLLMLQCFWRSRCCRCC